MNRTTTFLFIGSIALSLGIGYVIGHRTADEVSASESEQQVAPLSSSRAPLFGENRKLSSAQSDAGSSSIDAIMRRYASQPPEKIEEEIDKFRGMDFGNDTDFHKIMSLTYLSYKWGKTSPRQALLKFKNVGGYGQLSPEQAMQRIFSQPKNK